MFFTQLVPPKNDLVSMMERTKYENLTKELKLIQNNEIKIKPYQLHDKARCSSVVEDTRQTTQRQEQKRYSSVLDKSHDTTMVHKKNVSKLNQIINRQKSSRNRGSRTQIQIRGKKSLNTQDQTTNEEWDNQTTLMDVQILHEPQKSQFKQKALPAR